MASTNFLLSGAMARLTLSRSLMPSTPIMTPYTSFLRPLSTTAPLSKTPAKAAAPSRKGGAKGGKASTKPKKNTTNTLRKKQASRSENFARIKILRRNMFSPAPPPLRMARLRHLRHWTIHRAWLLFRRSQREATERERQRMHWGMHNACEELRRTVGPQGRAEGYLYRVAMEKKGVWGTSGIPIEYARGQTDAPATKAWNHEWKRAKNE